MSKRLEALTLRKQLLIDRCAQERTELAAAWDKIRSPFRLGGTLLGIGTLLGVGRTLRSHPIIVTGLSSLLVSGYGAKLIKQLRKMLQVWRLVQPIQIWWRKCRAHR